MPEWTLVNERLPDEGETVLLQWRRGERDCLSIAEWSFNAWHIPFEGCVDPVAWMPLPEFYEQH